MKKLKKTIKIIIRNLKKEYNNRNITKKNKKKKKKLPKILSITLLVSVIIFFLLLFYIHIINTFLTILLLLVFLALVFGISILNFKRVRIYRIIGYILSTILITIILLIGSYLFNTLGFLFNVTDGDYTIKNYNVIVLSDSKYTKLKELKKLEIGISQTQQSSEMTKAMQKLHKKLKNTTKEYDDVDALIKALNNEEIEVIILENSEIELLKDENPEFSNQYKIIYQLKIRNDIKDLKNAININKEPFNIYLSGIDTFGSINATSRSDVNIVLTVNPVTEQIHITWIPRDYYVKINNTEYYDKLTHAGIYGIESSIYAIENLLDIDINYYVKVNFTSVIELVDLLGGITIYNEEAFTSKDGFYYEVGNLTLDGIHALSYVRERDNVAGGDLGRGKNQVKVLTNLLNKIMSKDIIKNYHDILKATKNDFLTNMNEKTMFAFIRHEISHKRNWQIDSYNLTGTNSFEYTYSYKKHKLYVMLPDEAALKEIQNKLHNIL